MDTTAAEPDVLAFVLKNAQDDLKLRDVCALLCTSKAAAATAAQHFTGSFCLWVRPKSSFQAEQFCSWMAHNAGLVQSLEFEPHTARKQMSSALVIDLLQQPKNGRLNNMKSFGMMDGADSQIAGLYLAGAFKQAAASSGLMGLSSFICRDAHATVPPLLQALPSSLTKLDLHWESSSIWRGGVGGDCTSIHALQSSLARLVGLQSLLLSNAHAGVKDILPLSPAALRPLVALTELELQGFALTTKHMAQLPASLQRLKFQVGMHACANDVQDLGHLTALTKLSTGIEWGGDDVLPPNVVHLDDLVRDVKLLLPLKSLRHLGGWITAEDLAQLGAAAALPALKHVVLSHDCEDPNWDVDVDVQEAAAANEAAEYDGGLRAAVDAVVEAGVAAAVRRVELLVSQSAGVFGTQLVQQLSRLPCLSALLVEDMSLGAAAVAECSSLVVLSSLDLRCSRMDAQALLLLPGALGVLPNLRELLLPGRVEAAFEALPHLHSVAFFVGIAGLHRLRRLGLNRLHDKHLQGQVEQVLAAATQLKAVQWVPC